MDRETILIGHSLENDLTVLHVAHMRVIDTSLIYPGMTSSNGRSYKQALQTLVREKLGREIDRSEGHDSMDDARAALELVIKKVKEEEEKGKEKVR